MKQVFHKPISHFVPLAPGIKIEDLATLNEAELAEVLQRCKEQEAARVYQSNPDFVITQVADEYMAVPTGEMAQMLNGMVSLNRTGHYIWEQFQEPRSLREVLDAAQEQFNDEHHLLDFQLREYAARFASIGLLKEIK